MSSISGMAGGPSSGSDGTGGAVTGSGATDGCGGARGDGGVTLARVVRSEWTKLWSLRSTRWALLVAFLAQAGIGPLFAVFEMDRWSSLSLAERVFFNPIDHALVGYRFAQLAIGVLGVLIVTGEYSTGQIRSSLLAVPARLPVLWAKLIVFSGVAFLLMLIGSVIAFFAANAIFVQHHVEASISTPHAIRAVIGAALYMTVTGILCTAIGTILRSTAGGISTFVAILFVLPPILLLLPTSTDNAINPWLPSVAGSAVASALPGAHSFSAWGGFGLFCGYVVAVVAVAAYLLRTRDA